MYKIIVEVVFDLMYDEVEWKAILTMLSVLAAGRHMM